MWAAVSVCRICDPHTHRTEFLRFWGRQVPCTSSAHGCTTHRLADQAAGWLGGPLRRVGAETSYDLLGLASYFTAGEIEARAWTFHKGMSAPQCAGVIHTDFEKGFIKAEVVTYDDLIAAGSIQKAKDNGKYRLEGKEYLFLDGDVVLFRFNV